VFFGDIWIAQAHIRNQICTYTTTLAILHQRHISVGFLLENGPDGTYCETSNDLMGASVTNSFATHGMSYC